MPRRRSSTPIANAVVGLVFASYPPDTRRKLLGLRQLVLDTAAATEGVGEIEETLKWGEPAYATTQSRSGSTLRLRLEKVRPNAVRDVFQLPDQSD